MARQFQVKIHNWIDGELQSVLMSFNTFAEAIHHARHGLHHLAKVYDQNGFLVHTENKAGFDAATLATYA